MLCCLAFVAATRGLVRYNTWYLASDQFAFLTFADDLARGTVFHDPSTVELIAGPRLPREAAADAYYQTYILRDGRLYSRYPPGYPLLLTAVGLVGGETARHRLNPLLYLALLAVLGRLAARLAPGLAPWAAAAATMWALLVIPVEVHYWGITVARDLPAHLLALLALLRALAAAPASAGLLLGLAATIRPDAVLWTIPAALVLPRTSRDLPAIARGGMAFAAGLAPLLAYNTVTQGHPLAFTQGSEFRTMLQSALGFPGLLLTQVSIVSGGGFRLVHFPTTFPAHVRYLVGSFGVFLWLALGMLLVAAVRRLPIWRALGSYVVIGLLFYSCWSHGDPRYLVGVSLSLIVMASVALVRLAGWLADSSLPWRPRLTGLLVVAGVLTFGEVLPRDPVRGLTTLERGTAAGLVAATIGSLVGARVLGPLLPAVAFAGFGAMRILASGAAPEGFRADDVARARAAIETLVPRGALVLTSPGLGRPAENWTHYTHADAHYVGELPRLFSDANYVAYRCALAKRPLFLLLGTAEPLPFTVSREWISVREVARREGAGLREWFVDPQRASGAVLYQATFTPPK